MLGYTILACVCTLFGGYLFDSLLNTAWNWPDVGAIFAVVIMGAFLLNRPNKNG